MPQELNARLYFRRRVNLGMSEMVEAQPGDSVTPEVQQKLGITRIRQWMDRRLIGLELGEPQDEQPQDEQPQDEQPQDEQPQDEQPQDEQPQDEQGGQEQPEPEPESPPAPQE